MSKRIGQFELPCLNCSMQSYKIKRTKYAWESIHILPRREKLLKKKKSETIINHGVQALLKNVKLWRLKECYSMHLDSTYPRIVPFTFHFGAVTNMYKFEKWWQSRWASTGLANHCWAVYEFFFPRIPSFPNFFVVSLICMNFADLKWS